MLLHFLGLIEGCLGLNDVVVGSEVGHWIVDLISERLLLMEVLNATSGRADWVRLKLELLVILGMLFFELGEPLISWQVPLTVLGLLILQVLKGVLNVPIATEVWYGVVSWWVCWCFSDGPEMSLFLLLCGIACLGVLDVVIFAKVWNEVVDWMAAAL